MIRQNQIKILSNRRKKKIKEKEDKLGKAPTVQAGINVSASFYVSAGVQFTPVQAFHGCSRDIDYIQIWA